jgi:hypothetical protein
LIRRAETTTVAEAALFCRSHKLVNNWSPPRREELTTLNRALTTRPCRSENHCRGLGYVWFAANSGAIGGYIDIFSEGGTLLTQLTLGGNLNQPSGFAIAPNNFGPLRNTLLISNNIDTGAINAYKAVSGQFVGIVRDSRGEVIHIDQLWRIALGDGAGANGNTGQSTSRPVQTIISRDYSA